MVAWKFVARAVGKLFAYVNLVGKLNECFLSVLVSFAVPRRKS